MTTISLAGARRLALARGGLLGPRWSGLPARARGRGEGARAAAVEVVRRFGYLQLDTVSVAGARSHALVLLSRLAGLEAPLAEGLLSPAAPLFEYWGHEACWIPLEMYPLFEFRRRAFRKHPWWGDLVGRNPRMARAMLRRVREEGPLRTSEFGGGGGGGWWDHGVERKVLLTLWSAGDLAIRERVGFQRVYDLPERVIPGRLLSRPVPPEDAVRALVLRALEGHGWATRATLAATWRIRPPGRVDRALRDLEEGGEAVRCDLVAGDGARVPGWARPRDLDLAARLARLSPREDRGVLLSPFDPVLWDRTRVGTLFGFHQRLECYTPARRRVYGYFCLPVLAGERLVARVDLKADRGAGRVRLLALHHEAGHPSPADREAVRTALARHAAGVGLSPPG